MAYTNAQDIRDLLGLTVDEAPDSILDEFIAKAGYVVLHYIQIPIVEEVVELDISGQTIVLSKQFIADNNFDEVVNASDLVVYGYVDEDHVDTRNTLTVSTIFPENGVLKLSADASDYEKVTVSYSYYTCAIDWPLVEMATAYYAGMLWVAREEFLVPEQLIVGNVRVRQKEPWSAIRTEFLKLIYHITEIPMDVVNYKKIMVSPRSTVRFSGPGTTYEVEDQEETSYQQPDLT